MISFCNSNIFYNSRQMTILFKRDESRIMTCYITKLCGTNKYNTFYMVYMH